MLLQATNLGGMAPIVSDRLLPDNFAADAANVDLVSGEARPLRSPVVRHTFATGTVRKAARLTLTGGAVVWLPLSSIESDVIKAPIVNDAFERFYILDPPGTPMRFNTGTRLIAGDPSFLLGLPAPVLTPTVTPSGGTAPAVTRSYLYTFVDVYGQEGPPSLAGIGNGNANGTWTITTLDTTIPDAGQRPAISKRIYRTEVSASGTAVFYFVAEIALATASYVDTIPATTVTLNTELDSVSAFAPPPTMGGVVLMPGGFFVGFTGRTIHCSTPYKPWEWPPEFDFTTEHRVVGLGVFDQTLAIMTSGAPYAATGTTPSALTPQKSDNYEPCIAKRSIVSTEGGVLYSSVNGLILVGPGGVKDVTRNLLGRLEWAGNYAQNITGAASDDTAYVALVGDGDGFTIDSRDQRVAFTRIQKLQGVETIWNDPLSSTVYMFRPGDGDVGGDVLEWQPLTGEVTPLLWRSKEFKVPAPTNFGWGVVHLDLGPSARAIVRPPTLRTISLDIEAGGGATIIVSPAGQHEWRRRAAVVGYFLPGTVVVNETVPYGTRPPGTESDPSYSGWPNWAGLGSASGLDIEGQIVLPTGVPAWFNWYCDRQLMLSIPIFDSAPFRLPAGFKTDIFQWAVVSSVPVFGVQIANSAKELRQI